jgi:hypothetical protein
VKNAQGKRLMEWIEENGWEVLNGNKQGHEEEEWSYIGSREETVIDYGIVNEEAWESVKEFRIGERVEERRMRLEKVRFEEQDVKKLAVELKEVIEKAITKKKITARVAKGTERRCFFSIFLEVLLYV